MATISKIRLTQRMRMAGLAAIGGAALLFAQQAAAATWRSATWGRAWVTVSEKMAEGDDDHNMVRIIRGQTQDTKTDGYCVYIRARLTGQSWPAIENRNATVSCGSITSFEWGPTFPATRDLAGVRLYRDDGRYLTLWGS